jgi:hypothetical protein
MRTTVLCAGFISKAVEKFGFTKELAKVATSHQIVFI